MTKNELLSLIELKQKKYRREQHQFLIEGTHLIEEVLKSAFYSPGIETIYHTEKYESHPLILFAEKEHIPLSRITVRESERITETKTPQGIYALIKIPENKNELKGDLILALDNINDPGNLGTIIRTCYWFGIKEILLSKETADIYNSKVLRSSQGAVFHTLLLYTDDMMNSLKGLIDNGYQLWATDLDSDNELTNISSLPGKNILLFGNESHGVNEMLLNLKGERFKIKNYTSCESLNVAVSVGIVLHHFLIAKTK